MLIIELKPWGKSRRMEISLQYIRVCVCVCVCTCMFICQSLIVIKNLDVNNHYYGNCSLEY